MDWSFMKNLWGIAVLLFLLTACNKKQIASEVRSVEEQTVLEQSAFYPEQPAPEAKILALVAQSNGETGTIGDPNAGTGGGDGGSIPGPGTGSGSSSGSGSSGSGSSSGGSTGGGSTSSGGGSSSDGSGTGVADGSGGSSTDGSGSDGGSIPGGNDGSGSDGGTISDGSGSTGGDGGNTDGGNGGTDVADGGGSTDGSGGSTDGNTGGSDGSGSTGGSDGSNDGGGTDVADGGGSDGGSIDPGGDGSGTDGGNTGGTDGGTDVADGGNSGGSDGGSDGSGSTGGTDGNNNGGTDGNSGGGTDVADGGDSGGGSDGGTIDPGGDGSGTDGGNTGGNDGGTDVADGGDTGGSDGNNNGGDTGGNTGGTDGNNNGSDGNTGGGTDVADGGDSGGGSDGGTIDPGGDGSGTDGGNTGGNDGGTDVVDGGNTGGTDGNNNGGDTGGSNNGGDGNNNGSDGNNNGGTDVADGGNNNGGNNNGGGNDGGTVGGGDDPTDGTDGGNTNGKVGICHIPPGNPENAHTIEVAQAAIPAHLAHGDVQGECPAKVGICHIPPGNPDNAHTIEIAQAAVAAHLAHGDLEGECPLGQVNICHTPPTCGNEQAHTIEIPEAALQAHLDHGDTEGACPQAPGRKLRYKLSRVCSEYRSRIKYPDFIFFEEARNPILSIEASIVVPASRQDDHRNHRGAMIAMPGFFQSNSYYASYSRAYSNRYGRQPATPTFVNALVRQVDLRGVDLFSGRHQDDINFTLDEIKRDFPQYWEDALVTVRVCDDSNGNGLCSDEVGPRTLSINNTSFLPNSIPRSVVVDVWHGRHMLLRTDPEFCEKQYSPIVLDLEGDGIKLVGPGAGTQFDLNDEGKKIYTGWTGGDDDAFLVRDVNGNGKIDSGAELFGSATRLKNGERASDGFTALREHDDDGDGLITEKDGIWSSLRLWVDRNRNGETEKGEIYSLRRVGLESINLNYVKMQEVDEYGNETRMRSTFRRRVGRRSFALQVIDVWFNTLIRQDEEDSLLSQR